ncbi:MAG TPA: hypothetical protein VN618_07645 [Solirubrobacteraceae bacterium]|nr:hypothetical protein [Solirubrobacteraceae bacterium]
MGSLRLLAAASVVLICVGLLLTIAETAPVASLCVNLLGAAGLLWAGLALRRRR